MFVTYTMTDGTVRTVPCNEGLDAKTVCLAIWQRLDVRQVRVFADDGTELINTPIKLVDADEISANQEKFHADHGGWKIPRGWCAR